MTGNYDPVSSDRNEKMQTANAGVLGQLLALQNFLFVLPTAQRISEFYAHSLASVPGVTSCCVCLNNVTIQIGKMDRTICEECKAARTASKDFIDIPGRLKCKLHKEEDIHVITLETYEHHFGFFVFSTDNEETFSLYKPFINNLANFVALSLENRLQKNLLKSANDELERKVEKRTDELRIANESLKDEIEERWRVEKVLRDSEEKYRALYKTAQDAILIIERPSGKIIDANPAACRLYGYTNDEIRLMSVIELSAEPEETKEALRGEHYHVLMRLHKKKSGEVFPVEITAAVFSLEGQSIYVSFCRDITEREKAEQALREEKEKLKSITDTAQDAIIMLDCNGKISFWNPAAEKIFGYESRETIGKDMHKLIAPVQYRNSYQNGLSKFKLMGAGSVIGKTIETEAVKKDGVKISIELSLSSINIKGTWNAVGVVRDITERKHAQEQLIKSLNEKEILLKEIYHRVKNNLQVITSLLKLQQSYLKDSQAIEYFRISQMRIKTMALIHEQLYRSKNLSSINFEHYIDKMIYHLFQIYGVDSRQVSLQIKAEDVTMGLDTALPCGLLITELVSNSLKHAFPNGREGIITIKLSKTPENKYVLVVEDNGIGIPEKIDYRNSQTMGLQLVSTLTEQLDSEVKLECKNGTKFTIIFPELDYIKRV